LVNKTIHSKLGASVIAPFSRRVQAESQMQPRIPVVLSVLFLSAPPLHAGMTVYDLNDVVRLRLEDISFFVLLLVLCALGVKFLWNQIAKGYAKLP
jgi:hypothetical protein